MERGNKMFIISSFYGVQMHDNKAYIKYLKRVAIVKEEMRERYLLHPSNFIVKKTRVKK
jgi:hypothetical protein